MSDKILFLNPFLAVMSSDSFGDNIYYILLHLWESDTEKLLHFHITFLLFLFFLILCPVSILPQFTHNKKHSHIEPWFGYDHRIVRVVLIHSHFLVLLNPLSKFLLPV